VLLAGGGTVKSAGQFIILKNNSGKATMLILTNASGNFKPDIFSAQETAAKLGAKLRLQPWQIIVTKGEPFSNQAIKVYSKGSHVDKSITQERLARFQYVEGKMKQLGRSPEGVNSSVLMCASVLVK
jgi:hypothetical protein